MDIGRHIRRQMRSIIGPAIGLSLSLYFGYHLVEGDRGLIAWVRLTEKIRIAKAQAAEIHADREAQEQRVQALRPDHLDPDMLDEQARAALNLVGPNEIVIPTPEAPKDR
jgi:cell division protein FtsB